MAKLISSLNIGDKVRFGKHQVNTESKQDIIWQVAAKNHPGYPSNSVTLVAEKIIDIRGFDAKEPSNSNSDRQKYGNNRYKDSNLRQWLNKAGKPWFVKTHTADEPPTNAGTNNYGTGYDTRDGFLSAFNNDELGAILNTSLKVAKNTVTDGGGSETVTDKVFLLSTTEVGLANENSIAEGSRLPLFTTSDSSRITPVTKQVEDHSNYDKSGNWYWWLRTPYSGNSRYVRGVYSVGSLDYDIAYPGHFGVRPALNLDSGIGVSDSPDSNGVYTLSYNNPPTITGSDENLGNKNVNFNINYQVNDSDAGDNLKVVEKLNGSIIRTIDPAYRAYEYTINVNVAELSLGAHTVTIEVEDGKGGKATRVYTFTKTNAPPTISGTDENLGDKNIGFQITYQVDDPDGDAIVVKEKLNGDVIRTRNNPPKNQDISIVFTDEDIRSLPLNSTNTVTIEADDGKGGTSYRTYTFKRVNTPPIISGTNEDLGVIEGTFTKSYVITDAESDGVTVKEFINSKELRSYQATLGASNSAVLSKDEFIKLPNGSHELKIIATDTAGAESVRIFSFQKQINKISIKLKVPFTTDERVTKVFITPTWDIEHAESVKVEACNNAFDTSPTWEDITDQVLQGKHFNLTNETKTASSWGVDTRIEMVKKADATGEIEITGFGGAFE